jgi:hypothetical protein
MRAGRPNLGRHGDVTVASDGVTHLRYRVLRG